MITVPLSFDDIAQCYYIVRKQALLHRPWFAKHFSSVPGLEQHQHPPGGHGRCALTWTSGLRETRAHNSFVILVVIIMIWYSRCFEVQGEIKSSIYIL